MSEKTLKPGWRHVKFGDMVRFSKFRCQKRRAFWQQMGALAETLDELIMEDIEHV